VGVSNRAYASKVFPPSRPESRGVRRADSPVDDKLLLTTSCARVPPGTTTGTGKILAVRMTVRGSININRQPRGNYYFFLINRTDNPTDPGPVPVVGLPWGNGFAAPSQQDGQGFVGFVLYDRDRTGGTYGVFSCEVNDVLQNPVNGIFLPLGPPDRILVVPQAGESTLAFQLDLGRLPNPNARYVQLNIIATNNLPQGVDNVVKYWDAIGDSTSGDIIRTYVLLDTTQNPTVTNSQQIGTAQEIPNDVRDRVQPGTIDDPDIDIVDWQAEIRNP
jgi:hypothetical protein